MTEHWIKEKVIFFDGLLYGFCFGVIVSSICLLVR